jgi:YidC/Oxa1 family membrane protein insertase
VDLRLPEFPRRQDRPDVPFQLFERSGERTYEAQSGLIWYQWPGQVLPVVRFTPASKSTINWADGQDQLVVDLKFSEDGVNYTKRFTFDRGDYDLGVRYLIDNQSDQSLDRQHVRPAEA